jgi:hypothetical protein
VNIIVDCYAVESADCFCPDNVVEAVVDYVSLRVSTYFCLLASFSSMHHTVPHTNLFSRAARIYHVSSFCPAASGTVGHPLIAILGGVPRKVFGVVKHGTLILRASKRIHRSLARRHYGDLNRRQFRGFATYSQWCQSCYLPLRGVCI